MTKMFNEMIVLGESKKEKTGDGVNEVLTLMKEVRDFQDKIDACAESQTRPENRTKIQEFSNSIEEMYGVLLEMAKGGIRSLRKAPEASEGAEETEEILESGPVKIERERSTVTPPVAPII